MVLRCVFIKSASSFSETPLCRTGSLCYTRNSLLWAAQCYWQHCLRKVIWRVLCGQWQVRGSLFYSLHTTGHTHYNLIEHKGTLTIITIKSKQSTLQINDSFKTCFLTSVSSQTYGYCPLEMPQSDGQESATTTPSAVPAIMFEAKLICTIFKWLKSIAFHCIHRLFSTPQFLGISLE